MYAAKRFAFGVGLVACSAAFYLYERRHPNYDELRDLVRKGNLEELRRLRRDDSIVLPYNSDYYFVKHAIQTNRHAILKEVLSEGDEERASSMLNEFCIGRNTGDFETAKILLEFGDVDSIDWLKLGGSRRDDVINLLEEHVPKNKNQFILGVARGGNLHRRLPLFEKYSLFGSTELEIEQTKQRLAEESFVFKKYNQGDYLFGTMENPNYTSLVLTCQHRECEAAASSYASIKLLEKYGKSPKLEKN